MSCPQPGPPSAAAAARGEEPEEAPLGSGLMFDRIARRYDRLNRILSLGVDQRWRRLAIDALGLRAGAQVLDLATGTGDLAIRIARRVPSASIVGLDPSAGMLAVAREKISRLGLEDRIELRAGDAQALPFDDDSFDGVTIAFGIRNVPDRSAALAEMARVCRPGARIAVLELGEPRSGLISALARLHIRQIVPRLGAWLSGAEEYRYLQRSVAAFPEPERFADQMRAAGHGRLEICPLTFGVANLYLSSPAGAERPAR
ncbi:MAG: bifunctional demethylmenaquinone methyltransferase/2-methoxy-6-polyprenyl-1,4-benzoquinol methylase UbiE [Myxococcales bacterium]|nr:bifunctional demethylmenaquinone methyltransferase/2-methoxy-6-polyprenyl-1,4-benzoquinol methylase UbiE [Myxococcales bacterium]